jgi:hypothetical protein
LTPHAGQVRNSVEERASFKMGNLEDDIFFSLFTDLVFYPYRIKEKNSKASF